MIRADALESLAIIERLLDNLMTIVPSRGRPGSDARTAIGDLRANALVFLRADTLGTPFDNVFSLVQQAGATQPQFAGVRGQLELEAPITLGANLTRDLGIIWCLSMEALIIAAMQFDCRGDVDELTDELQQPFNDAEEIAADAMDQMTFQDLISLHAAITNHLVVTALPLPRLLAYQFADILPSLVIAYRLYADASRCDQIRAENEIVHPLFCPIAGLALSA